VGEADIEMKHDMYPHVNKTRLGSLAKSFDPPSDTSSNANKSKREL